MKRITYLIVAMLMAFTMVGCQFDPTYLEDKISGLEKSDEKQNERLDGLESRVADIERKLEGIDFSKFITSDDLDNYAKDYAKLSDLFTEKQLNNILANYVTTSTLDNYAKLSDLFTEEQLNEIIKKYLDDNQYAKQSDIVALNDISNAVSAYLNTVTWSNYVDGYTKSEMDEKLEAITNITSKLEETYATINKLNELSVTVTSLENKPTTPSGNGGDGYCGLSADEVTNIKTLLTQWANNNISGVVYSLTDYVKESELAGYVKIENLPSLEDYAKKTDIKDFTSDIATLTSRITTVENMLKADGTVGKKLAELETKVNNTNATEVTELKNTVDAIKAWYEANKDKVTNLNLADYLTVAKAESDYATKSSVETVATSLAELTSRVETLEGLLTVDNELGKVITNLNNSIKANADKLEGIETVKASLDELSETIATNKTELEGLIASKYSDIEAIQDDVDKLKTRKIVYSDFADTVITELDKLYQTKGNYITSDYITKELIEGLIGSYITTTVTNANNTLKTEIASNYQTKGDYATKTELANYLTSESQIIKDLTNGLATWNVKKGKFIDTTTHNACAYYLINDSICIGYPNITMVDETYTFEDLMIKANQYSNCRCEVSNKKDINRNVVFE